MAKKRIKSFNNFTMNENTEFNFQRMNSDPGTVATGVDNPSLSVNSFDKHQNKIQQGIATINTVMGSLSSQIGGLKSKMALEEQNITALRILRILSVDNIDFDIYIAFTINEYEYWGVIEKILSNKPTMNSEVFKDTDLILSKEWVIKTKGILIKTIKEWLNVEPGTYITLKDDVSCVSNETGRYSTLDINLEVDVIRAYDNKILIKVNNELFTLNRDSFIYFNWWFDKKD